MNDVLVLLLAISAGLCVGASVVCLASFVLDFQRNDERRRLLQRVEEMVRQFS